MEKYACFDIGSGVTKLQIVEVSEGKIQTLLKTLSKPILLRHDLYLSKVENPGLSKDILIDLKSTILKYLSVCKDHEVPKANIFAYATEVFRVASNGKTFLESLQLEASLTVIIPNQETEAKIGFNTAIASLALSKDKNEINENEMLVWDSGGGSFQISNNFEDVLMGKLGTAVVTNYLAKIKNIPLSEAMNPVTDIEQKLLFERIITYLETETSFDSSKLKNMKLFGIGDNLSLFANAYKLKEVHLGIKSKTITAIDMETIVKESLNKNSEYFANLGMNQTEMILPRLTLICALLKYMNISEFYYLEATGGCLGFIKMKIDKNI